MELLLKLLFGHALRLLAVSRPCALPRRAFCARCLPHGIWCAEPPFGSRGSRGTARGGPGALRRWPTPTVGLLGVYGTSIRTHCWMLSADFNMCLLSARMGDCTRLVAQLTVLWVKNSCSNVISAAGGRSAMHLTAIGAHSSDPDRWPPGSTCAASHPRWLS